MGLEGFTTQRFMIGVVAGLALILIQPFVLKTLGLKKAA